MLRLLLRYLTVCFFFKLSPLFNPHFCTIRKHKVLIIIPIGNRFELNIFHRVTSITTSEIKSPRVLLDE